VLALRPMVWVGKMSYSLYLWHWPLFVFAGCWTLEPLTLTQRLAVITGTVVCSFVSWKFVETPFRKRVIFPSRASVFAFGGGVVATVCLLSVWINKTGGIPSRFSPEVLKYVTVGDDVNLFTDFIPVEHAPRTSVFEIGDGDKTLPYEVMVVGDSHAWCTVPVIDDLCKQYKIRGFGASHVATAPLIGYESPSSLSLRHDSIAFEQAVLDFGRAHHVKVAFLMGRWGTYAIHGVTTDIHERAEATVKAYTDAGIRVYFVLPIPQQRWIVPEKLAASVYFKQDPERIGLPIAEYHEMFDPIIHL
jgi:hypothetical protein